MRSSNSSGDIPGGNVFGGNIPSGNVFGGNIPGGSGGKVAGGNIVGGKDDVSPSPEQSF